MAALKAPSTPPRMPWRQVVADLKARGDDLSLRAASEIESLRETQMDMQREISDAARGAAEEATWRQIQGDEYGSY